LDADSYYHNRAWMDSLDFDTSEAYLNITMLEIQKGLVVPKGSVVRRGLETHAPWPDGSRYKIIMGIKKKFVAQDEPEEDTATVRKQVEESESESEYEDFTDSSESSEESD
jgi:hypothetical protein